MSTPKRIIHTLAIPVLVAVVLELLCLTQGQNIITNAKSFDNFVVYTAIVMITTMALSINLNSGRFDFSLGSMAALSSVIGAQITYSLMAGGKGSSFVMLIITLIVGVVLGLISGGIYVILRLPPIITSLGVTLIYEGILYTLTSGKYVMKTVQNNSMSAFVSTWVYAFIIITVVLIFMIVVFEKTKWTKGSN